MDPTSLHFSRSGLLVQLLFFSLFCILGIWGLSTTRPFQPEPQPISHYIANDPTPDILFDEIRPQRHEGPLEELSGGWLPVVVLLASIVYLLWAIALRIWRLIGSSALLVYRSKQLLMHSSLKLTPEPIAIGSITLIEFGRADELKQDVYQETAKAVSFSGYIGAKLGQKLRHNLRISYIDSTGAADQLTVSDIEVDGGVGQLRRFTTYLETMRAAELQHSGRA
ncbi:hypothetical protein DXH95_05525 [Sphingorhabdus pulchriflava]|uniref:Uncharacterized protein n=2 Tax=Sphingorhabdus pulchriflava TaxID=2292257 RepID=A0A371BH32_9SPHN|nr:hypothetical protein DXH95_05525 [Sphingorhabdus pulchriflava]